MHPLGFPYTTAPAAPFASEEIRLRKEEKMREKVEEWKDGPMKSPYVKYGAVKSSNIGLLAPGKSHPAA